MTKLPLCSLRPYIMPSLEVSSDEVKGKVEAREVVSMFLVTMRWSMEVGRVVLKPTACSRIAGGAEMRREARGEVTCLETWSSSVGGGAGRGTSRANWKKRSMPLTS